MDLLPSQKKQIFEILVENGFDPNCFELTSQHHDFMTGIPVLLYKNSGFFFAFNIESSGPYSEPKNMFSPGATSLVDTERQNNWFSQTINFGQCLINLRREINVKNPWEHISDYLPDKEMQFRDAGADEKFSPSEVQQIEKSLGMFKDFLLEKHKLTEDQIVIVNQKLDYLCDCAKRSTKIDWKNILVGTTIQLFVTLGLTSQQAHNLWQYLFTCFVHLLSLK